MRPKTVESVLVSALRFAFPVAMAIVAIHAIYNGFQSLLGGLLP